MECRLGDSELSVRCGEIRLLVLDVDGVLTDGVICIDDLGVETKRFHVRDGLAIDRWHRCGRSSAILSGRTSAAVERRAAELGIARVVQGARDKIEPFGKLLEECRLRADQICYMGDDLPDLPILRMAGLSACPADAAVEVLAEAHVVSTAGGGRGAVREVIELILKHQDVRHDLVEHHRRSA